MKILVTGANGDIAISIYKIIKKNFKNNIKIDGTEIESHGTLVSAVFRFDYGTGAARFTGFHWFRFIRFNDS